MIKEFSSEDMFPLETVKNKIWSILDILRSENIPSEDYSILLFFLAAYKDELISGDIQSIDGNLKNQLIGHLQPSDTEATGHYFSIIETFEPIINQLSDKALTHIIQVLSEINKKVLNENYTDVFETILYSFAQSQGKYGGDFFQPDELTRLIYNLADLPPNSKVYNPFAGLASFSVYLDAGHDYYGQEINQKTWALGALRIMAHERPGISRYVCNNSISNWPSLNDSYDLIVSNPPFGAQLDRKGREYESGVRTFEDFLIENGMKTLKDEGKLIAILSQSAVFNGLQNQSFWKSIVDGDFIDTVISLPGGLLLNTGIPIVIIVLSRKKKIQGKVRFVDAKNFVIEKGVRERILDDYKLNGVLQRKDQDSDVIRIVDLSEIQDNNYSLNVARYFLEYIEGVKLGEILEPISGKRGNLPETGKLIRIKDLTTEVLAYRLDSNNIEEAIIPINARKITESCLLLATKGKTLKPTYFNYDGAEVFISPEIVAFKIDESKIDLDYLVIELHARYVSEQLDSYKFGSLIPQIKIKDLLSIKISVPNVGDKTLQEQKAIVKRRLLEFTEENKQKTTLFSKIHGLEAEIIEQNTYLRHILAGPSSNLNDSIASIRTIISEKIIPSNPHLLDLKLSDKHLYSLGDYLAIIERDARKIVSVVSSHLNVESGIEGVKLYPIELCDYLSKYSAELTARSDLNYKVEFAYDKKAFHDSKGKFVKTYILADVGLLRELFDFLIDNANKHAFTNSSNNRIEIFLMKNDWDEEQNEVTVLFSNTGKSFPQDFTFEDFVRKGSKKGSNAGEGFGGWYINEIINKFEGSFDIIDERGAEGLHNDLATSFEINFPIFEIKEDV